MRRKNTQKKSQFNFLLKEQDGTFKIDDWEIANNPEMILGRRNSDLVDDWLELFSDMPDSIADDQYVRVANNFLQKIGSRYRCVAKVSQNADGEITWKMTESSHKTLDNVRIHETTRKNMRRSGTKNLSEQSVPSMKKNILAENMKRFATKNLAEQNSRVQVKRIASDKLSGGEFEDNFVVNGKYKVEVYRASDGDFSATTAYFAGEDIMEDEFDTSIFGGVSNADVYDAILGFYEK